jgi:hypothetical protein
MPSQFRPPLSAVVLASSLACFGAGCELPTETGYSQGPGRRPQALALTPRQELSLGEQAYKEICAKYPTIRTGRDAERVKTVGQRIQRAADM